MKKMIFAVLALMCSLSAVSAVASDFSTIPSAFSNQSPGKDRTVLARKVQDVLNPGANVELVEMTMGELTSNRPTLSSMSADSGMKLCVVKSKDNPVCNLSGIIVSAEHNPDTLTIATFKHASGEPMNVREVSWNEFYDTKSAVIGNNGPTQLYCHFKNGRKTSICRMASNN